MLIKKYIQKQWLLLPVFSLLFLLSGCGVNDTPQKETSPSSEENLIKFKTHKALRKIANISAILEISGIGIYDMTVNADDTVSTNVSSTTSIMPEGNYRFTITYYQGPVILADIMTDYDIKIGSNNIDFTPIPMNYNFDDDGDGTTNMDEIRAGSDPGNASPSGTIDTPAEAVTIVEGESVDFTGTGTDAESNIPLTYLWDFGGGAENSTEEGPGDVTFNTVGTYTVTFTVTDSQGQVDHAPATTTVSVTVPGNLSPDGTINTPTEAVTITQGESIDFTGTGTDPDNNIPLTYLWDFGGGAENSTEENPGSVTFNTEGTYTVTFTVTDNLGQADPVPATTTVAVTVPGNLSPDGAINTPTEAVTITQGESVDFTGTGTDPDNNSPLTYLWNFGGGAGNSTEESPGNVTFNTAGTYTVTFTVTDSLGLTDPIPATATVTVNAPPDGTINTPITAVTIAQGESVDFTGTGTDPDNNSPLTYLWDFGGGAENSTEENPGDVTFNTEGTYTVTFAVTDSLGLADPTPATVTVITVGWAAITAGGSHPVLQEITNLSAKLEIFGVGVYGMSMNTDGTVTTTIPSVPVGSNTFTLTYYQGTVKLAEVVTIYDVNIDNNNIDFTSDDLDTYFDDDGDGTSNLDEVKAGTDPDIVPPDGTIDSPTEAVTIFESESVNFIGTGMDPDNNIPLTYLWDFGGGAENSTEEDPGDVIFDTAGAYTVTFTVTDSQGQVDPTPATVIITVEAVWTEITAGAYHTVALKSDGTLWTWGSDLSGQLGNGDETNENKKSPTQIGTDTDWAEITAGNFHTVALKSDGTLWAWGSNLYGQLGNGDETNENKKSPTKIDENIDWSTITAGGNYTVALKSDGSLWAWGSNGYGKLGDGTTEDKSSPTNIGEDSDWSAIIAGWRHTVALKSDGTLWAWGSNGDGQLGNGDGTTVNKNSPTLIGTYTNWAAITAGMYHTVALKSDGTLWTWGSNGDGQLGNGTTAHKDSPTLIGTYTNWAAIAAGGDHTVALKSDGTLWAWGSNSNGQLGNGDETNDNKNSPTLIGIDTDWTAIKAGGSHTVALKSDGTLWTWGYNWAGQLGDGTTENKNIPTQIGVKK